MKGSNIRVEKFNFSVAFETLIFVSCNSVNDSGNWVVVGLFFGHDERDKQIVE